MRMARSMNRRIDAAELIGDPAPIAAGFGRLRRGPRRKRRRRATGRAGRAQAQTARAAVQAEVLHRARVRDRAGAGRHHHPEGRALRQRHRRRRAGVHGLHDGRRSPRGRSRCAAASPGSIASAQRRFDKRFLELHRAEQRAGVLDDIAWPQKAKPEFVARRRVLQQLPRPHRRGFWSSKMGIDDLQYIGNVMRARVEGLSGRRR